MAKSFTCARNPSRRSTLYSTNRMEAVHESQLTGRRLLYRRARPCLPGAVAVVAGLALRLGMLKKFSEVNGDALIYGGLAKNLLLHGRFALTVGGEIYPTLIRLPGYPLFLAVCFRLFGMENYASAAWVEIVLDLTGCVLLTAFVRRIAPPSLKGGAAQCTLWLAALCPFTAIYAVQPLTEAPTLFVISLALWAAGRFRDCPGWGNALWFTFAVSYAALLRPDGALIGVALAPALVTGLWPAGSLGECASGAKAPIHSVAILRRLKPPPPSVSGASKALVRMAVVCVLLALAPFAVWTWRNWTVFHVFEPLAPRLATDPGED